MWYTVIIMFEECPLQTAVKLEAQVPTANNLQPSQFLRAAARQSNPTSDPTSRRSSFEAAKNSNRHSRQVIVERSVYCTALLLNTQKMDRDSLTCFAIAHMPP